MPVVKVWALPEDQTEEDFLRLYNDVVAAVVTDNELPYKDEKQVIVLFPPDLMSHRLGTQILIEVSAVYFSQPNDRSEEYRGYLRVTLAKRLVRAVNALYPKSVVVCHCSSFGECDVVWSSHWNDTFVTEMLPERSE